MHGKMPVGLFLMEVEASNAAVEILVGFENASQKQLLELRVGRHLSVIAEIVHVHGRAFGLVITEREHVGKGLDIVKMGKHCRTLLDSAFSGPCISWTIGPYVGLLGLHGLGFPLSLNHANCGFP